jgi:cell shape-determining protein MreC
MRTKKDKIRHQLEDLENLYHELEQSEMDTSELPKKIEELRAQKEELEELERKFIFAESKIEADTVMAKIIKFLPNDLDLGGYIRNLYANKMWK